MVDWDNFASDYDSIFLEYPMYVNTIEEMVAQVEEGRDKKILDVGCGTGNVTERLHDKFPSASVLAVDPSEGMREVCVKKFEGVREINVAEGGSLEVPAAYGEFDSVLSNLALHHVLPEQRGRCAAELARVLKPGGTLIYADIFSDVDGSHEDPAWCRDMINKTAAWAINCLDHGAYQMMLLLLKGLLLDLTGDGEYPTTIDVWIEALEGAGFSNFEVVHVPPAEIGIRIIRARST